MALERPAPLMHRPPDSPQGRKSGAMKPFGRKALLAAQCEEYQCSFHALVPLKRKPCPAHLEVIVGKVGHRRVDTATGTVVGVLRQQIHSELGRVVVVRVE